MFIVDSTNNLRTDGARPAFHQGVINAFRANYVPGVTDYCHSISAGVMQAWIYELIKNTGITPAQKAVELQKIAIALRTPPGVNAPDLPPSQNEIAIINNLCAAANATDQAQYANQLYTEFFNEINNLRVGSLQWNRAVQKYYDPISWIHIAGNGTVDFNNNGFIIPANLPRGANGRFFLTNNQDNRRMSNIIKINNVTTDIGILSNWGHSQGTPIAFVYSSDNNFWIDAQHNLLPGDPIYFFNDNTNQWEHT